MHHYFHDEENRKVYRVPIEPNVREERNHTQRQIIGWNVSALINVTRANNRLENGKWKFSQIEHWEQSFENIGIRYTKKMVIEHFFNNHLAGCEPVTEDEYRSLKAAYEADARGNTE